MRTTPRSSLRWPARAAAALGTGLLTLGAAPALAAPSAAQVTVTATDSVGIEGTVDVEIGLGDVVDVYAYALTVEFDGATLAYTPGSAVGPAGGFESARPGDEGVTLVHSRLGTSPALSGDLLATMRLSGVAAGTSAVDVQVTLVDAAGATTVTPTVSTEVEVLAPEPTPTPTDEPTVAPTPDPTDGPTDVPTEEPTDGPTEDPTDVPTEEPTGPPAPDPSPSGDGDGSDGGSGGGSDDGGDGGSGGGGPGDGGLGGNDGAAPGTPAPGAGWLPTTGLDAAALLALAGTAAIGGTVALVARASRARKAGAR